MAKYHSGDVWVLSAAQSRWGRHDRDVPYFKNLLVRLESPRWEWDGTERIRCILVTAPEGVPSWRAHYPKYQVGAALLAYQGDLKKRVARAGEEVPEWPPPSKKKKVTDVSR